MATPIYPGVLCTNPVDTSIATPQNVWTTRVAPILGNAVITQVVVRDTVGFPIDSGIAFNINVQNNTTPMFYLSLPPVAVVSPRYVSSVANYFVSSLLGPNPTVTATVTIGYTSTPQTVQVDLIGYYI